jgi:hypothetical protein
MYVKDYFNNKYELLTGYASYMWERLPMDNFIIQDWYASANYQLGRIEFADGNSWDRSSGKPIEAYFQELAAASQQTRDPVHQCSQWGQCLTMAQDYHSLVLDSHKAW